MQTLTAPAPTAVKISADPTYYAGPITDEQVNARLARNSAINLTKSSPDVQMKVALQGVRGRNITRYNAALGLLSVLDENHDNNYPLLGTFGYLPGDGLTVVSYHNDEPLVLSSGTQVLALGVDTSRQEGRILCKVNRFNLGSVRIWLTPRQAALAFSGTQGVSLLDSVTTRLSELR